MIKKIFVLILISLNTLILNANINSILNQNKTYEIYKADYKEKTFNAVRYINNNYSKEQIKAENIYSTSSIDVYLENGLTVDEIRKIFIRRYKNKINTSHNGHKWRTHRS